MSIFKEAARLADEWMQLGDKAISYKTANSMADLLCAIAAMDVDANPLGYLCEWQSPIGEPNSQVFYYGEHGSAIEDDWNRHPDVHKNLPLYTQQSLDAAILKAHDAAIEKAAVAADAYLHGNSVGHIIRALKGQP